MAGGLLVGMAPAGDLFWLASGTYVVTPGGSLYLVHPVFQRCSAVANIPPEPQMGNSVSARLGVDPRARDLQQRGDFLRGKKTVRGRRRVVRLHHIRSLLCRGTHAMNDRG